MDKLIELLPLYAELQGHPKLEIIKHYARACVAHATSPLQAEIEALRVEVARRVEGFADKAEQLEARAERLAEALQEIEAIEDEMEGGDWDEIETARKIARAALHLSAAQENDNA